MQGTLTWLLLAAGCVGKHAVEPRDCAEGPAPCGREEPEDSAAPLPGGPTDEDPVDDTAPDGDGPGADTASPGADTASPGADTASPGGEAPAHPADVLDLTDWKLTLPVASDSDPESPREVKQPELGTFALEPWFRLAASRSGVVFDANAGGVTTSGSHYPRSELREMTGGGAEKASWSTTSGVHTMTITQAIHHVPEVKPHVVAGQIHDADDDVVMIRLEGENLYVEGGGENLGELDPSYTLGEEFTVRFVATDGRIDVYYNDLSTPVVRVPRDTTGCYFKAGVYTQSNTDRGDAPEAYGEVEIRDLVVTHE